eukprot:gene1683-1837_t
MFLSREDLPHATLWKIFFTWNAPSTHYTIYWHTHVDYRPPPSSFFKDKQIKKLIPTAWGDVSLPKAHRNLIEAALEDPENQYFVLLSESCIPLVPFSIWYRTIMTLQHYSIVNGCDFGEGEMERKWRWTAALNEIPGLLPEHWRKSGQWSGLNRKHAEIIVHDPIILTNFRCKIPEEHYIPTILAVYRLDNETTCSDGLTHVYWQDNRAAHPTAYTPEMIGEYKPPLKPVKPSFMNQDGDEDDDERDNTIKEYEDAKIKYENHKTFIDHVRNTNTHFGVFSARCAYFSLPPNDTILPLPPGALRATEEAPCHFSGRKFPSHTMLTLLLRTAEDIFRDDAFGLQLTQKTLLHRYIFPELRYNPSNQEVYLMSEHELLYLPDVRMVDYQPSKVSLLPNISLEEKNCGYKINYGLKILQDQPFLYKIGRDASVWWVTNYTRFLIPDFDTFLAHGWDVRNIRNLAHDEVKNIPAGPMLPSLQKKAMNALHPVS